MKSQGAYALWPKGRLGALEAAEEGSFTTLPLMFEGRKLVLNVQTKHAGYVQVEAADGKGRPLPGQSFAESDVIIGDHLNRVVTWQGEEDLKKKPDQAIMLRFRLRAAKLFAFEFGV